MKHPVTLSMAALFVLFMTGIGHGVVANDGVYNLYAHQADAFLNGRLHITEKLHDVAIYNDKYYVPFPPFPSVVLLPFVALFGLAHTKATLISALLTIVSAFTFYRILKRLDVDDHLRPWLIGALFLGTGYWLTAKWSHEVWFFAHVIAFTCMLLAIHEALGAGRGAVVGAFLSCAILSRQLSVYSGIFLAVALLVNSNNSSDRSKIVQLSALATTVSLSITVYLIFNKLRFDDAFRTGYSLLNVDGFLKERLLAYRWFNPMYIIHNLTYMFLQGPHFIFDGDVLPRKMDPFGTSLTFASPFLFVSLKAEWKKPLLLSAWCAIGLCLLHMSLYHANGWVQINTQRYSLDFIPILILLVALAAKRVDQKTLKSLIAYAVLLNFVALVVLNSSLYTSIVDAVSIVPPAAGR